MVRAYRLSDGLEFMVLRIGEVLDGCIRRGNRDRGAYFAADNGKAFCKHIS